MSKHISLYDVVSSTGDLLYNCWKTGMCPTDYLEYSNGEQTVVLNQILLNSDPILYWSCELSIYKKSRPSALFIAGYNAKANEIGMLPFDSTHLIILIIFIALLLQKIT